MSREPETGVLATLSPLALQLVIDMASGKVRIGPHDLARRLAEIEAGRASVTGADIEKGIADATPLTNPRLSEVPWDAVADALRAAAQLDAAWKAVEAALPEGWLFQIGKWPPLGFTKNEVGPYEATAVRYDDKYNDSSVRLTGSDLISVLLALADALRAARPGSGT